MLVPYLEQPLLWECYAKCIDLSKEKKLDIWNAIKFRTNGCTILFIVNLSLLIILVFQESKCNWVHTWLIRLNWYMKISVLLILAILENDVLLICIAVRAAKVNDYSGMSSLTELGFCNNSTCALFRMLIKLLITFQ